MGKGEKNDVNIKEYKVTFLEESIDRHFQEVSVHVSDVGKSSWTAQTGLTKRLTIQQIKIKGGHYYHSWQNAKWKAYFIEIMILNMLHKRYF